MLTLIKTEYTPASLNPGESVSVALVASIFEIAPNDIFVVSDKAPLSIAVKLNGITKFEFSAVVLSGIALRIGFALATPIIRSKNIADIKIFFIIF